MKKIFIILLFGLLFFVVINNHYSFALRNDCSPRNPPISPIDPSQMAKCNYEKQIVQKIETKGWLWWKKCYRVSYQCKCVAASLHLRRQPKTKTEITCP